jgi:sugar/nucleoside kinase (ribokinase family)
VPYDLVAIDKSWVDILLLVPALPGRDEKVLAELLDKTGGGMGGNVVCAASRLGLRTGMVSWVGDDPNGQLVLDDLRSFEVDTHYVSIQQDTLTNYTTVLIDSSGEKAILIVPTTFDTLTLTQQLKTYLQQVKMVYCTPFDLDQLAQVSGVVRSTGNLVCTDIEPAAGLDEDGLREALSLVDIAFIDADTLRTDQYEQAAQELKSWGPRLVIMGLGSRGSVACDHDGITVCPAFKVSLVDSTGAGDCFAAACVAGYLKGYPLRSLLRYASAAAALSIQGRGARGALPSHVDVENFLSKHAG